MFSISPFTLNPAAAGLDRLTAYWAAAVCHATYEANQTTRFQLWQLAGATSLQRFNSSASVAPAVDLVLFPGNRAGVAIRGTQSYNEFFNQVAGVLLLTDPFWTGRIGSYWRNATLEAYLSILPTLTDESVDEVFLTGHSLGGACAQLLVELLIGSSGFDVAGLITFGCPRTGDFAYAAAQTAPYTRITNQGDPIPLVPAAPSTPLDEFLWLIPQFDVNAFRHWGTRFHLWPDGSQTLPPDLPNWTNGFQTLVTTINSRLDSFTYHSMDEYARRLRLGISGEIGEPNAEYNGLEAVDHYFLGIETQPVEAVDWQVPVYCQ